MNVSGSYYVIFSNDQILHSKADVFLGGFSDFTALVDINSNNRRIRMMQSDPILLIAITSQLQYLPMIFDILLSLYLFHVV